MSKNNILFSHNKVFNKKNEKKISNLTSHFCLYTIRYRLRDNVTLVTALHYINQEYRQEEIASLTIEKL